MNGTLDSRGPIRHLAPEAQLLFHLLGGPAREGAIVELLESEELDWRYFSWLVGKEKAIPVVSRRLGELPAGLVPEVVLGSIARQRMVTDFRMARLEERLIETLAALREAGIEVILLKGAGLAAMVYDSFAERPMADVDLLVTPERGDEAWEVVRRAGWRPEYEEGEAVYDDHQHYPPLLDEGGTTIGLDLHTSLLPADNPFDLSLDRIWRGAEPVTRYGEGVYVPDGASQVLHLCLHFAWSHVMRASAWRSCRDLGALLESGRIDWAEFVELANSTRAATCSYWTLRLARDLAGIDIPEKVLERLASPGPEFIDRCLERHFISQLVKGPGVRCPSPRISELAWTMGIRPGWSGHGSSRPWSRVSLFHSVSAGGDDAEGSRIGRQFTKLPELGRYLGFVLGLTDPRSARAAASRAAISSSRGLRASASREETLPAR